MSRFRIFFVLALLLSLSALGCTGEIGDRGDGEGGEDEVAANNRDDGGASSKEPDPDEDGTDLGEDPTDGPTDSPDPDEGTDPVDDPVDDDPVDDEPASDPDSCGVLGYFGRCDGEVLVYCAGAERRVIDCGAEGARCELVGEDTGFDCVEGDPVDDPVDDPPDDPPPEDCGGAFELEVISRLNAERESMGLGALSCDPLMAHSARLYSADMCERGVLSHTDANGDLGGDRARELGVQWSQFGENIARGQRDPEAVHRSWMNSWGHRRNRLASKWGRVGVGYVACGDSWGHYWTEVFAD